MIIETSSQFSCLMSFQRTNKLIPVDTQMVEQYSRHGVRVTELTPSQRCSLLLFFYLIIFVDDDFCFSILFGCSTIHISCNLHCFLTCLHTLPALSSHIFIKSNQSNSTNHQGPPGENDLEAAGNLSQRTHIFNIGTGK